jgi:hypothetical protein
VLLLLLPPLPLLLPLLLLLRTWLMSTPRSLVEGWLGGVSRARSTTVLSPACTHDA